MVEVVINDDNYEQFTSAVYDANGNLYSRGLEARCYATNPLGSFAYAKPFDLPIIPQNEWQSRLTDLVQAKAQLSNIRDKGNNGRPIPSRDQNGYGYCWAHSSVSAMLLSRARQGEDYADLSAFAVACIIKNFRNRGGFGAESLEFIAERGVPTSQFWPQQSTSRANDNPQTWANAANYKVLEWMDLDPSNMKEQYITCLLLNIPVVSDYNWWMHSVCSADLVSLEPFQSRIWNSWSDSWSANGMGILEGRKAIPNGAIAPRVVSTGGVVHNLTTGETFKQAA